MDILSYLENCTLCPRNCHANRRYGTVGFCGQGASIRAARAALHFWEEPIISGKEGSGAVFFSGCNLRCIFCQNHEIAIGECGKEISLERLSDIFLELQDKGANNINLVTGAPYVPFIVKALKVSKTKGLAIPILYNSSGYESIESLKMMDGLIDIYMPDMKYYSSNLSREFSNAPDYFEVASLAISEMYRQVGPPKLSEDGSLLKSGMIVRHLLLPDQAKDSKKVLRYLYETYGDNIYISIMSQYTPLSNVKSHPILGRKISNEEYDKVVNFAIRLGITNAFIQEGEAASESFIPAFDYEGI